MNSIINVSSLSLAFSDFVWHVTRIVAEINIKIKNTTVASISLQSKIFRKKFQEKRKKKKKYRTNSQAQSTPSSPYTVINRVINMHSFARPFFFTRSTISSMIIFRRFIWPAPVNLPTRVRSYSYGRPKATAQKDLSLRSVSIVYISYKNVHVHGWGGFARTRHRKKKIK